MPGIDLRSMLERSGRMGRHEERMRERANPCRSGRDQKLQLPRLLLMTWNLIQGARKGPKAEANPWRAQTLEWTIPSPPPTENFETLPVVHQWPYEYGKKRTADDG